MKILSFDVETNSLLGQAFAVGACLVDTDTCAIEATFSGRAPLIHTAVEFVRMNVLPAVQDLPTYPTSGYLRYAFWQWYKAHDKDALIFVDCGYPVETGFLRLCQEDVGSEWAGAFPLHEVATLLLANGVDPQIKRTEYAADLFPVDFKPAEHNPLHDAMVSALTVCKALKETTEIVVVGGKKYA